MKLCCDDCYYDASYEAQMEYDVLNSCTYEMECEDSYCVESYCGEELQACLYSIITNRSLHMYRLLYTLNRYRFIDRPTHLLALV